MLVLGFLETWLSGRKHLTANEAGSKSPRRFESVRLRQGTIFLFIYLLPEPDADENEVNHQKQPDYTDQDSRSAHHASVAESILHHEIIIHQ